MHAGGSSNLTTSYTAQVHHKFNVCCHNWMISLKKHGSNVTNYPPSLLHFQVTVFSLAGEDTQVYIYCMHYKANTWNNMCLNCCTQSRLIVIHKDTRVCFAGTISTLISYFFYCTGTQ